MLNKQDSGKIDWTDYTWNPITGCLHGCDYCYLKRLEKRFGFDMKPAFHPERLDDIGKLKKPAKIFVGSTADMWGDWVPNEWIDAVLDVCRAYPAITFQFLTKNPDRYNKFKIPINCWVGTTVDGTKYSLYISLLRLKCDSLKFISFEPLLSELPARLWLGDVSWIIIGADSNIGSPPPPNIWANNLIDTARLQHIPIWVKDNYRYHTRIKEFPVTYRW